MPNRDFQNGLIAGAVAGGALLGATSITVDATLSTTSENPVQNKVITEAFQGKVEATNATFSGDLNINNYSVNNIKNISGQGEYRTQKTYPFPATNYSVGDLTAIQSYIGATNENSKKYDFNCDGKVNVDDISLLNHLVGQDKDGNPVEQWGSISTIVRVVNDSNAVTVNHAVLHFVRFSLPSNINKFYGYVKEEIQECLDGIRLAQTKYFYARNYTSEDLSICNSLIGAVATVEQLNKYDINQDGEISLEDYNYINYMINGGYIPPGGTQETTNWKAIKALRTQSIGQQKFNNTYTNTKSKPASIINTGALIYYTLDLEAMTSADNFTKTTAGSYNMLMDVHNLYIDSVSTNKVKIGNTAISGIDTGIDLGASNNAVPTSLAVKTYVDSHGGGSGSSSWDDIQDKPFNAIEKNVDVNSKTVVCNAGEDFVVIEDYAPDLSQQSIIPSVTMTIDGISNTVSGTVMSKAEVQEQLGVEAYGLLLVDSGENTYGYLICGVETSDTFELIKSDWNSIYIPEGVEFSNNLIITFPMGFTKTGEIIETLDSKFLSIEDFSQEEKFFGLDENGRKLYQKTMIINNVTATTREQIQLDSTLKEPRVKEAFIKTYSKLKADAEYSWLKTTSPHYYAANAPLILSGSSSEYLYCETGHVGGSNKLFYAVSQEVLEPGDSETYDFQNTLVVKIIYSKEE